MPYYGNITRNCGNDDCRDEYMLEGTHYEGGQECPPEFISQREIEGKDDTYCERCQDIVDEGKAYKITLSVISTEKFEKMGEAQLKDFFAFLLFERWESRPAEYQENSLVEGAQIECVSNLTR